MQSILIVDDDEVFAKNLAKNLLLEGYKTNVAFKGLDAVEFIRKEKPDILICDLKLPDIDGDEVIERIKKESPSTLSFVVSAYVDTAIEQKLKRMGVLGFMYKPVIFDDVTAMIQQGKK